MKKISPTLVLAILTLMVGLGGVGLWSCRASKLTVPATSSPVGSEEADEYAVYSAVIRNSFLEDGVKLLVIQNRTLFYANPDYLKSTTPEQRIQDMKHYYPSVDEFALRDFDSKHLKSVEIAPNLDLPVKYVLINKDDFDESSDEKARHVVHDFYQRYPGARGIIALSRVGFNRARDQAFVRVEFTFCPLCGHGDRVFLKKEFGKWRVVDTFFGWAS